MLGLMESEWVVYAQLKAVLSGRPVIRTSVILYQLTKFRYNISQDSTLGHYKSFNNKVEPGQITIFVGK